MRLSESALRRIIRDEILQEDLRGFLDATRDIEYSASGGDVNFTGRDKKYKDKARAVKRAWADNSDQSGLQAAVRLVHWFPDAARQAPRFLGMGRNNEISASMYPKGKDLVSVWGPVGMLIEGWITLAANEMNDLMTGYGASSRAKDSKYYSSSGLRKRPAHYYARHAGSFVLGPEDLKDSSRNEAVVASWSPISWVLQPSFFDYYVPKLKRYQREELLALFRSSGLPIIGSDGRKIDIEDLGELAG
jgi:hypothetical protein